MQRSIYTLRDFTHENAKQAWGCPCVFLPKVCIGDDEDSAFCLRIRRFVVTYVTYFAVREKMRPYVAAHLRARRAAANPKILSREKCPGSGATDRQPAAASMSASKARRRLWKRFPRIPESCILPDCRD